MPEIQVHLGGSQTGPVTDPASPVGAVEPGQPAASRSNNEPQRPGGVRPVVIIGSGPAGYTAALYAARAGLQPLLYEGDQPGGQLTTTTTIENFPGFPEGIGGTELMDQMRAQATRFGAEIRSETVRRIELSQRPFVIEADGGTERAAAVILAMGAAARHLGLESEAKLTGHGVSTCATCDGFFFRGKRVVVVGGGDSALEDALYLSKLAASVQIIHRRDQLRASRIMQERIFQEAKIQVVWNAKVAEILDVSQGKVTGVRLQDTKTGESRLLECDGVFVAVGHDPVTQLVRGQVDLDPRGYVLTHDGTKTSVPGVFAAGDIQDPHYRQAITAAASGCQAAMDTERYLQGSAYQDWGKGEQVGTGRP